MKKILPALFLFILSFSCTETAKKENLKFDHLKVEKSIYASNDSTMPYMKLFMEFTYPVSFSNDTILARMQRIFVQAFAGEEYEGRSPQGAFERFEKNVTEEYLEMASMLGEDISDFSEYYQNIKTDILDSTANIITLKTETSNYTGGAHGAHKTLYYNIDIKNGELLNEEQVFKPESNTKLSALILKSLHKKYGERINEVLFDLDEVQPNNNFYFNENGVTYVYNEYEIAPYSEGLIEVLIPFEEIKDILRPDFKP